MLIAEIRNSTSSFYKEKAEKAPDIQLGRTGLNTNSYSIKGKGTLLKDATPAVVEGVLKTILTAAAVFGIIVVSIPLLIPILFIGVVACLVITPFIINEENKKQYK